jgi:hypothetical protein
MTAACCGSFALGGKIRSRDTQTYVCDPHHREFRNFAAKLQQFPCSCMGEGGARLQACMKSRCFCLTSAAKEADEKVFEGCPAPTEVRAGSQQVNDSVRARLKSCPDTKPSGIEFFSRL